MVVLCVSVGADVASELERRVGKGGRSKLADELLRIGLWPAGAAAAAPGAEDLNTKRQTFIEDFKATAKSEEKAEGLMRAAIRDGLFSNQSEFRRALKNA